MTTSLFFRRFALPLILALVATFGGPVAARAADNGVTKGTATVSLNGRTLFEVKERMFSFSAGERAEMIARKISRVAKMPGFQLDQVNVVDGETTTDLVYDDTVIMSITDKDAAAAGVTRLALAEERAETVRAAIADFRETRGIRRMVIAGAYAFLFTLLLYGVIRTLLWGRQRLKKILKNAEGRQIRTLSFKGIEIVSGQRMAYAADILLTGLTYLLIAGACYIYLPAMLSLFPWTKSWAPLFISYIRNPIETVVLAVINYIPDFFFTVIIIAIVRYVLKFVHLVFTDVGRGRIVFEGFYAEWAMPTYQIVRFAIFAFTAVVVFPYLPGSSSPAFRGISVFLGILFSLGSTSAVANVVAGIILTYMRAFTIGDRVKIADSVGDVVEKTILITRLRTIKNVNVTIPNAMVLSSHIINYSASAETGGLILHTSVTIGYAVPWRQVHELLIGAAAKTENIMKDPKPFILQTALNDFHVSYELNAHTDEPGKMAVLYSALHQNIQDDFAAAGVEIMSPGFLAVRRGSEPEIPAPVKPTA